MSSSSTPDRSADFLRAFAAERRRLYGFIFSLVANAEDAEDIFQQTSLVLWKKFDEFQGDREFFPWAAGIALNHVRNHRRSLGRSRVRFSDELLQAIADHRLEHQKRSDQRNEMLKECLANLESRDRDLIVQMYSRAQSPRELAKASGQAIQTIYNRIHKIRTRLLRCVDRKWAEFAGA